MGNFPVTGLMGRQSAAYFHLGLENTEGETETLKVTGEHPLFSPAKGWVQANSLVVGDTLITQDGTEVTVTANTLDLTPSLVYNLEVAEAHTYFVGEFDVWSHNASKKAPECGCGTYSAEDVLNFMLNALGAGYSDEGNGRYRSADGKTQVRFGEHETRNPKKQHCHIEDVVEGAVTFTRTYFFK